jgi:hypothetical protein
MPLKIKKNVQVFKMNKSIVSLEPTFDYT